MSFVVFALERFLPLFFGVAVAVGVTVGVAFSISVVVGIVISVTVGVGVTLSVNVGSICFLFDNVLGFDNPDALLGEDAEFCDVAVLGAV